MIALLYHNKKRYELAVAIAMAKAEYEQASHTQGYPPTAVQLNPQDVPADAPAVVAGLEIYADEKLKAGYIRICNRVEEMSYV